MKKIRLAYEKIYPIQDLWDNTGLLVLVLSSRAGNLDQGSFR